LKLLKDTYEKPLLLVEGYPTRKRCFKRKNGTVYYFTLSKEEYESRMRTFRSAIVVAYISFDVPVIICSNRKELIDYIELIYRKSKTKGLGLRPVHKKGPDIVTIRSDILTCIPGIGRKRADILAKQFTISQLISLPVEELLKIEGIGPKRAESIKKALTS